MQLQSIFSHLDTLAEYKRPIQATQTPTPSFAAVNRVEQRPQKKVSRNKRERTEPERHAQMFVADGGVLP